MRLLGLCLAVAEQAQHSFEHRHPNIVSRGAGLAALKRHDFDVALTELIRAAPHADKGSQAVLVQLR